MRVIDGPAQESTPKALLTPYPAEEMTCWLVSYQSWKREEQRPELDRAGGARRLMSGLRFLKSTFFTSRLAVAEAAPHSAFAWGDEGHQIIALIAVSRKETKITVLSARPAWQG
jgi:hypothetical protein